MQAIQTSWESNDRTEGVQKFSQSESLSKNI